MIQQPLAEVFGSPITNQQEDACRNRRLHLCPFNNRIPNCSKNRISDPLGVCSIYNNKTPSIICPIRLRENWLIIENAAKSFFGENVSWTTIPDVRMYDKFGTYIDTIEFVRVVLDYKGVVTDFASVDTQAAYVRRDIQKYYNFYLRDPEKYAATPYEETTMADYNSTFYYRIAPQLIYRGSIFHSWKKKMSLAMDSNLFSNLPVLTEVASENAEILWQIYDLNSTASPHRYKLELKKNFYTLFEPSLFEITRIEAGNLDDFIDVLQAQVDNHLDKGFPPVAPTLKDIISQE